MVERRGIERPVESVEAVTQRLIDACGGFRAAAAAARVGKSQLHRYTDPRETEGDAFMPADVILSLEMQCGDPIMTRYLAAWTAHALVDTGRTDAGDYSQQLTACVQAQADLTKAMLANAAPGEIHARARALVEAAAGLQHMAAADMEGDGR